MHHGVQVVVTVELEATMHQATGRLASLPTSLLQGEGGLLQVIPNSKFSIIFCCVS